MRENPNAQPTKLIKITVDPLSESTNVPTTIPTAVFKNSSIKPTTHMLAIKRYCQEWFPDKKLLKSYPRKNSTKRYANLVKKTAPTPAGTAIQNVFFKVLS